MPKLTTEVPHALGQDEALRRLKHQLELAKQDYQSQVGDLYGEWQDHILSFNFQVMGMKVAGEMAVEAASVRVNADLPLAAMMVKGMIEQRLRQELGKVLA